MTAPELVWLQAPSGHVIGMTLPLHECIVKQWRQGELRRVTADGRPWDEAEDDPAILEDAGEPAPAAGEGEADGEPALTRPRASAHKRAWQEYAVALGACSEEEAGGMTRAELIGLVTPPEEQPPDPEG